MFDAKPDYLRVFAGRMADIVQARAGIWIKHDIKDPNMIEERFRALKRASL
jgi:hypothetical protein